MTCVFCEAITEATILYQTNHFQLIRDHDPIQTGHLLLISKQHVEQASQLPPALRHELSDLEVYLTDYLCQLPAIDGVTRVCNDRLFDTGTHFHVHLIPRFQGDGFWDSVEPLPLALEQDSLAQHLSHLPPLPPFSYEEKP